MACTTFPGDSLCARAAPLRGHAEAEEPSATLAFSGGSFDPLSVENIVAGATAAGVKYGPAIWNGLRIGAVAIATSEVTVPILVGAGIGALAFGAYEWISSEEPDEAPPIPTVQLPAQPGAQPDTPATQKGVLPLSPFGLDGAVASAAPEKEAQAEPQAQEAANDTTAEPADLPDSIEPGKHAARIPLPGKHEKVKLDLDVELNIKLYETERRIPPIKATVIGMGASVMDVAFYAKGALQPSEWEKLIGPPGRWSASGERVAESEMPARDVSLQSPIVATARVFFPKGQRPADVQELLARLLRVDWAIAPEEPGLR